MTHIIVEITVSRRVGHVTFPVSSRTCCKNANGFNLLAIIFLPLCLSKTRVKTIFYHFTRQEAWESPTPPCRSSNGEKRLSQAPSLKKATEGAENTIHSCPTATFRRAAELRKKPLHYGENLCLAIFLFFLF